MPILEDSRVLAAHAEGLGAGGIAALAPSYFKLATLDRLVECCARIAGAAPAVPNLAGLKHTNEDLMGYQMALRAGGGRFDLPWGVDECLLAALAMGARGAVGSTYNFAAPVYVRLMEAFAAGDLRAAREEQWRSVLMVYHLRRRVEDRMGKEFPSDFQEDNQLQRGILELLRKAGKDPASIEANSWLKGILLIFVQLGDGQIASVSRKTVTLLREDQ